MPQRLSGVVRLNADGRMYLMVTRGSKTGSVVLLDKPLDKALVGTTVSFDYTGSIYAQASTVREGGE